MCIVFVKHHIDLIFPLFSFFFSPFLTQIPTFLLFFTLIPPPTSLPSFFAPPLLFFWLTPPPSVLCHLPRQGWALPSSPSHPSRLPGSGSGGSRPHRWSGRWVRSSPPQASSPQTSRLQRGPAEEQTHAEPRCRRRSGRGTEAGCQPSPPSSRRTDGWLHARPLQTAQHLRPATGAGWQRGWYVPQDGDMRKKESEFHSLAHDFNSI